jgi:DNA-directed RNA polymerase specialized sigma subunit
MTVEQDKQSRRKSRRQKSERDEQIISQMWKASQVAKKISSFTGLPYEELRDAALEYIVKIYDSWDQSKGANFSTWVNRCLQFHMLNYLRDNSRLVKIPRSYSDLYLKIRKYTTTDPDITDEQIAEKIQVSVKKIRAVRQAFAMSFSQVTEYSNIIEPEYESEMTMGDFMMSHRDLLHKITDLDPVDETFLTDYLVKKRSVSTLVRKNPHLKNADDIKKYSEQLIEFILCDASYPSKETNTRREGSKKSGQKLSMEQNLTTL